MAVWAIADLHLSFGVPNKTMDIFGSQWVNHTERVKANWKALIAPEDLVLFPGDISWALTPDQAKIDLDWIAELPGTKLLLRGNHDYWWASLKQIEKVLPPSMHLIQNNAFFWNEFAIGGTRLWDTDEFCFDSYIEYRENPKAKISDKHPSSEEREKIFQRELLRLETSLKMLQAKARPEQIRIAMTHYPPIGAELHDSRAAAILEKYKISVCVFGHLHNVIPGSIPFGTKNGVKYVIVACDAVDCVPVRIA